MTSQNVATFRLLGETMNVTKEFDFGPDYGYFPTYGGVRGSLSRVDNNNEFFGIKLIKIKSFFIININNNEFFGIR